jgi:predicted metalloprotease with PDZ domain
MRILLAIAGLVWAAWPSAAGEIHYRLQPELRDGALKAIAIEMTLPGEADGETVIELPDDWGGKADLWRGIVDFRVSGQGMRLEGGVQPSLKAIKHAPGATLTLRYRVTQLFAGDPAASETNEYRPVVRPGYFHLIGWTVFARPQWSLATPATVTFDGLPQGWRFASDLEHRERALHLGHVLESISVGGDFRILQAGKLRIAIRGAWAFSDEAFLKRLQPIIASHHRFWGDPETSFLVTVLPLVSQPNHRSVGGTALRDAFAFLATANAKDAVLTRTLAHEHLHAWIPPRLGMMPQENDAVDYWFSEGLTEFFTARLLARDGMWSVEEAARAFNDKLWAYAFSPARNASNAEVAAKFWSERAMNEMPYQRGFLFAALADARLRATGGRDLDDAVLAMKRTVDAIGEGTLPPPVREAFLSTMASFGADMRSDLSRMIDKGEDIALPGDVWAPCGPVETSTVAEFDRGFDGPATIANGNTVVGVDPKGPAYAAGLRNGMRIQSLDLSVGGDSRVALTYRIFVEGGRTREITYFPAGKRKVTLQELKLRPMTDPAQRTACVARLGGSDR